MTKDQIIHLLKTRWVSREEMCQYLGCNDNQARAWVRALNEELKASYSCVLSTARCRGYHIPNPLDEEDIAMANGATAELKAKAVSIFERRQAIENFIKYAVSADAAKNIVQPTLF